MLQNQLDGTAQEASEDANQDCTSIFKYFDPVSPENGKLFLVGLPNVQTRTHQSRQTFHDTDP
jgi:hypothetical protein